ncbi:hypothetical protein [Clostridium estertheticum]|uniref:hypothetical protein n=1 Tax=Clostridium estertheticum TaxID=238834 RepID=UPI001CF2FD8D|nr:hypothetical protein [Clostridium estertheticum]MCB2354350.1 hypothetical protein [Clostridium estertheticum]WAG42531.1 hypothetical protein LL065_07615 [Clostridium estertheticum]
MFIGFIILVVLAFICANSKNVNVNRSLFIVGLVVCWLGSGNMITLFGILSVIWLIMFGATIMGVQKSKAVHYLADKNDESKVK